MTSARLLPLIFLTTLLLSCNSDTTVGDQTATERDNDTRPNVIVILTDDQGYADVGAHAINSNIQTPHIDQMAAEGVTMSAGYITAPQCSPSRAGLLTGKYQQRFGFDNNTNTPLPLNEPTIADRLKSAGYRTGMIGKWHLEVLKASQGFEIDSMSLAEQQQYFPDSRGFDDVYSGYVNKWWTNIDRTGKRVATGYRTNKNFRVSVATDTANGFINQHKQQPFFLLVSYFAPHVPLEAPKEYLDKFSHISQQRRRYALAMMAAVDDGVGSIRKTLKLNGIEDNTLIFFISDNGAPLGTPIADTPVSDTRAAWDGSLNDPLTGEKGMLTEAGVRVPFIAAWPGVLPEGTTYHQPVSSLDIAATSLVLARHNPVAELDGSDLIPELTGAANTLADRALYWKFWSQKAIRQGQWKYLSAGTQREYLFDLQADSSETQNLINQHPDIVTRLRNQLQEWTDTLPTRTTSETEPNTQEDRWYRFYMD